MSDYCGSQRCKDLGCFGYCDYAKEQQKKYDEKQKDKRKCLTAGQTIVPRKL